MKRLIVNADDLGSGPRRNLGIVEAHRRGIVTSASILANGAAFGHAADLAHLTPSLDVGLHLNLSEGRPVLAGHRTLVDDEGRFLGKTEARERARRGLFDPGEIVGETRAQIKLLRDHALQPRRIDGHQHIHVYGSVAGSVARAAALEGIRFVRLPSDELGPEEAASAERLAQAEDYRRASAEAAPIYRSAGLRSTDHFGGVILSGLMTIELLVAALRRLGPGVTELMVHPGLADAPQGFDGPDRERELQVLTDPRVKLLLKQEEVELIDFRSLE